jgi:hypothetical protein
MLFQDVSEILYGSDTSSDEHDEKNVDCGNIGELPKPIWSAVSRIMQTVQGDVGLQILNKCTLVRRPQNRKVLTDSLSTQEQIVHLSIMTLANVCLYCEEFGVIPRISASMNKIIKGICGKTMAIGFATIPIPLR